MAGHRKIIHVDMDAFYASVEQRDDPRLKGKPVAVGGSSRRGVVAAASYEARRYGVHSAMPSVIAARKCPGLIFVPNRIEVYSAESKRIRAIFRRYTHLVEPLSLDEAYLDVTDSITDALSATAIARQIREAIREETGLTASAGVSFNKFLAKAGSDFNKPDGLTVVRPSEAAAFLAALPIKKFFGVGPVTARKMGEWGIHTGKDLLERSEEDLMARFGKAGRYFYRIVRGRDDREVRPTRIRKSIGAERTFSDDTDDVTELLLRLGPIAERVAERAERAGVLGLTVTLKLKYHDFELSSRQTTLESVITDADELMEAARLLLLHAPEPPLRPVRLLGLSLSNLRSVSDGPVPRQLQFRFRGNE